MKSASGPASSAFARVGSWVATAAAARSASKAASSSSAPSPSSRDIRSRSRSPIPEKLPLGRHYTPSGMYTQWQPGVIGIVDFDGGAFHRTQPLTCEHVQAVLRRVSGMDVTLKALNLASTWTDRSQQATTYRKGRVLLAGDAAHIHSPLGGQGLNLGLGDAMNLGWKLAATIRGDAPDGLLDSYTAERHPIGARILDWTRAQVALMRPDRQSRAIQSHRPRSNRYARRRDLLRRTGLGCLSPLRPRRAAPAGGPQLPGLRARGRNQGRRHGCAMETACCSTSAGRLRCKRSMASGATVSGTWRVDAKDRLGLRALLVRPDGFVAWASDTTPDPEEVTRAAARWSANGQSVTT